MAKKFFLNSEGTQQFSNALELLSRSIMEFNQVADKMVPEKLLTEGLIGYLKDFCMMLQEESNVKFDVNSTEEKLSANEEVEINLFRSVRSLLLLLINYSQSTRISLSVILKPGLFQLAIQNDGADIFRRPLFMVKQGFENVTAILASIGGTLQVMDVQGNSLEIRVPVNF